MRVQIEMPQLSSEGESATLVSWLVAVGDRVEKGEVIAELETDKSTVELEAPVSGVIATLEVEAGTEDVAPGSVLGAIESEAGVAGSPSAAEAEEPAAAPAEAPAPAREPPPPVDADAIVLRSSTPLARRAAAERGLDLVGMAGTGPGGRIVEADVLRLSGAEPMGAPAERPEPAVELRREETPAAPIEEDGSFEVVRLSAMRRTIARRLGDAKREVPHFYLRIRCSMDAVVEARARLNSAQSGNPNGTKLSLNDFVVKAAALALRDVPEANVRFTEEALHVFRRVDVCVAVATEGGLVTPVVRDADRKGLVSLSEEVKDLAERARAGRLRPEEYRGGTFTVSNLGMYGIDTVYPILNPPQACILGVGAAEEQPVVRDGEIGVGRVALLTLAADHRAVDGAVGARLLAAIRERLEDPVGMVL